MKENSIIKEITSNMYFYCDKWRNQQNFGYKFQNMPGLKIFWLHHQRTIYAQLPPKHYIINTIGDKIRNFCDYFSKCKFSFQIILHKCMIFRISTLLFRRKFAKIYNCFFGINTLLFRQNSSLIIFTDDIF